MSEALKDVETRPDNGTVEKFTGDEEAKVLEQWKAAKAREEDKRAREMEFAKTIQDAMQRRLGRRLRYQAGGRGVMPPETYVLFGMGILLGGVIGFTVGTIRERSCRTIRRGGKK